MVNKKKPYLSGTINTKKDIFSVKRGNEWVEVVDAKSLGS